MSAPNCTAKKEWLDASDLFRRSVSSGRNHWYNDQDHFMREMYLDVVDMMNTAREDTNVWWRLSTFFLGGPIMNGRWMNRCCRMIRTKYIIYPLMITGNGSMVMMTETVFPLPEKHIGWVYAERTVALRQVGRTSFSASSHKAIRQMISQAVSEHNQYMQGQCYGYELYRYGRCVDSDCEICGDLLLAHSRSKSRLPRCLPGNNPPPRSG